MMKLPKPSVPGQGEKWGIELIRSRGVAKWGGVLFLFAGPSLYASMAHIYIAQTTLGAATGADCSSAKSVAFFNASSNWGLSAGQIGPGSVVHLCGTFTGPANSTILTIQAGGTSINPVTILFEPNAVLQAPYFATTGAISCSGKAFVIIDGGVNGTIQNTANGTLLDNHHDSAGMNLLGCGNLEVKNVTVRQIYVRSPSSSDSCACGTGILVGDASEINVHDNHSSDAEYTVLGNYNQGNQNWRFVSNVLFNTAGCLVVGDDVAGASITNLTADRNECYDLYVWDSSGDIFHCDGFHVWASQSNSRKANSVYSNNYFHGDPGAHATGWIYTSAAAAGASSRNEIAVNNIFAGSNNVPSSMMQLSGGTAPNGANSGPQVYNNVFVGLGGVGGIALMIGSSTSNAVIENNIFTGVNTAISIEDSNSNISGSDYNEFNCTGALRQCFYSSGGFYDYASWRSTFRLDVHSIGPQSNPNLTNTYHPTATSPGVGAGANLTSLNISALSMDRDKVARPVAGSWDIGAYQYIVTPPPVQNANLVLSIGLTTIAVGVPTQIAISATGGAPPYVITVANDSLLPPGMSFSASDQVITGRPTQTGSFQIILNVRDTQGNSAVGSVTITVNPPLAIPVISLAPATTGQSYGVQLSAAGGAPPYAWSVDSGALPPGFRLGGQGILGGVASGAAATYTFTLKVTDQQGSTQTQQVSIAIVGPPPTFTADNVVNAASFAPGIAPGALASIIGTNLSPATGAAASLPLPQAIGGTTVTLNGAPVPVIAVSATQINFQVPFTTSPGKADLIVTSGGTSSAAVSVTISATSPGIFATAGRAIVVNESQQINDAAHPAPAGSIVVFYATGGGKYDMDVSAGGSAPLTPLAHLQSPVGVTIGSTPAEVLFAGAAPGQLSGLIQVNVRIPADLTPGDYSIVLSVGGRASNSALFSVR